MNKDSVISIGQVEYVEGQPSNVYGDEADGLRIKVRLDSDGPNMPTEDLPYAFPLLPKTIQSVPKIGEGVLIFTTILGNYESQRFYIGPIISQPQFQEQSDYANGRGNAVSLLQSKKISTPSPLVAVSNYKQDTNGAFPKASDIALIGRGQEDIILRYKSNKANGVTSEINLRAGIKGKPTNETNDLKGNVIFNQINPAYIQIKYKENGFNVDGSKDGASSRSANGIINMVADKINLISHQDKNSFGNDIADQEELVNESKMDDIMSKLHSAVYGEELIELLTLMVGAIKTHTHPFPMKPPCYCNEVKDLDAYNLNKIKSDYIRLS